MSRADEQSQLRDGRGYWFFMVQLELVRNGHWERMSLAAKAVYIVLLSHAGKEWTCYPGMDLIAREAGITRRSVITAIKELEEYGLIAVERHVIDHKGSRYTILPVSAERHNASDNDSEVVSREIISRDPISPEHVKSFHPKNNHRTKEETPPLGAALPFPLSADFATTPELIATVADLGLTPKQLAAETAKFIDHYTGTGECSLNWPGKWRNWMRREPDFRGPRRGRTGRRDEPADDLDASKYQGDNYLKVKGGR